MITEFFIHPACKSLLQRSRSDVFQVRKKPFSSFSFDFIIHFISFHFIIQIEEDIEEEDIQEGEEIGEVEETEEIWEENVKEE